VSRVELLRLAALMAKSADGWRAYREPVAACIMSARAELAAWHAARACR
jgi:hypothetical protein